MGLCFYNIAFIFLYDKIYPETADFSGIVEILSIVEEKQSVNKYEVKVKSISRLDILNYIEKNNSYKTKSNFMRNTKLIIYCNKNYILYPGDIIKISGKFEKANTSRNYKGFNYRNYLKQFKIHGIVNVDEFEKINSDININSIIQNIRLKILNQIKHMYINENAELLNGFLIGKTNDLNEDIKENFRNSSISHILAISGLHVSYVVIGINFMFSFIIKNKKVRKICIIICLILYVLLTGFSVSCIRACIMQSTILLSSITYRKSNFYRSFISALIIIIMINPFYIYNVGMWLSFLGTLGIVLFYKILFRIFEIYLKNTKFKKLYLYFAKIVLVTLSAQILIIPIMLYEFNLVSISFLISNLLISFLIGPILIFGYISILLCFIKFPLYKICVYIENLLLFSISNIAEISGNSKFSFYIKTPLFVFVILYYIVILSMFYTFNKNKYYYFKCILSIKYLRIHITKILKKDYIKKISIIFIILILVLNIFNKIYSKLEIHFIDVGQGDCTFIKTKSGKSILIDGGEGNSNKYDYGKNIVLPYLLDRRISKINFMIISHFDSDHVRWVNYNFRRIRG